MTALDALRDWHARKTAEFGAPYVTSSDLRRLGEIIDLVDAQMQGVRDPQRIGGQLDRESFDYAIEQLREFRWQHATNDEDAIVYINAVSRAHEREVQALRTALGESADVEAGETGELLGCPFCGGAAEFDDDSDGSTILSVYHDEDCPACMESESHVWSRWYYPEDLDPAQGNVREQVAEWWNRRAR